MTSTKGNGMRQIWKTIMMMITFALVVAAIVGSHYKGKADTTSQIIDVQKNVTAVETEQRHMKTGIEGLTSEFEEERERSMCADTSLARQIDNVGDSLALFKLTMTNKLDRILEKLE